MSFFIHFKQTHWKQVLYSFKHVLWRLYTQNEISFQNHIHHLVLTIVWEKEKNQQHNNHVIWNNDSCWGTNELIPLFHTFNKLWKHFFLVNQSHQFQTIYLWKHTLNNHIIHSQWYWFVHLVFHVPSSSLNNNQIHHNTSFIIIVYWVTMFIHQFNHKFIKIIPSKSKNEK